MEDIQPHAHSLNKDWQHQNNRLVRELTLQDFSTCVAKINQIAKVAGKLDHHPNLCIQNYKELKIEIYTHEADALTDKDYLLAQEIDKVL